MPLFATEGHNDLHHCGLVVDNYDFCHGKSQRGEYFSFEKKKAVLRIYLYGAKTRPPTIDQPAGWPDAMIVSKIDVDLVSGTAIRSAKNSAQIFPSVRSCRNARAGFEVTIFRISSGETFG